MKLEICPDCASPDFEQRRRVGPITGPGPDEWFYRDCAHPWHEGEPEKDPKLKTRKHYPDHLKLWEAMGSKV